MSRNVETTTEEKTAMKGKQAHTPTLTITQQDFENLKKSDKPFILIDVRTQQERDSYHIGGTLIPLDQLPLHIDQFNPEDTLVLYCKSGQRSLIAAHLLYNSGFRNVASLIGGIGTEMTNKCN